MLSGALKNNFLHVFAAQSDSFLAMLVDSYIVKIMNAAKTTKIGPELIENESFNVVTMCNWWE